MNTPAKQLYQIELRSVAYVADCPHFDDVAGVGKWIAYSDGLFGFLDAEYLVSLLETRPAGVKRLDVQYRLVPVVQNIGGVI